jgi:phenylpropionate dioxygenase-like ring-hydroxylating dioxygenase large terminal subunit
MDKSTMGLKPIECEIWHGMIFIRFFGTGPSVAETLKDAEEEISLYKIEDMHPLVEPWKMDFNCDWKSIVDIDSEGYHVPMGHRDLYDLLGRSYRDQVLNEQVSRSYGNIDAGKHKSQLNQDYVNTLPQESYLPTTHQRQWIYWSTFPGFVITLFPDQIEIYHSYPIGFQKSAMAGRSYALVDDRPEMKSAREYNRQINLTVGQEDVQLIKWSAEGMRSSAFNGAIMSDLEVGTGAFHNQLRRSVPVTSLDVPPAIGTLAQTNQQMVEAD